MTAIKWTALLALAAVMAACATLDARDQLKQAEMTYAAVVNTAADMRELGLLDDDTAAELTPVFAEANVLLDKAHHATVDGDGVKARDYLQAAETLLAALSRRLRNL